MATRRATSATTYAEGARRFIEARRQSHGRSEPGETTDDEADDHEEDDALAIRRRSSQKTDEIAVEARQGLQPSLMPACGNVPPRQPQVVSTAQSLQIYDVRKPSEILRRVLKREPEPTADPDLADLRKADWEYHRVCIDIQEPNVPVEDLPLEELGEVARSLSNSVERLLARTRRRDS